MCHLWASASSEDFNLCKKSNQGLRTLTDPWLYIGKAPMLS